jgi:hypothetical protein
LKRSPVPVILVQASGDPSYRKAACLSGVNAQIVETIVSSLRKIPPTETCVY